MRPSLQAKRPAFSLVTHCAAILLGILPALAGSAPAQSTGQYQGYPLKYKTPAEVERVLGEMLASWGPSVHVVADARNNQVLLRGPEQAQQVARQLIESIDRPAPPVAPVMRVYPCAREAQAELAQRLRAQFAGHDEVRIAADPQTAQLFILAPPEIHQALAPMLAAGGPLTAAPNMTALPPVTAPTAAPPNPVASPGPGPGIPPRNQSAARQQFVPLANSRVEQIEPALAQILGARLQPLANAYPGRPNYAFVDASGGRIEILVDRERNGLGLFGPDSLVRQLARLIESLDTPADPFGRAMRIVPVHRTDPVKVEEAVRAYKTGGRESPPRNNSGSLNNVRGTIGLVGYLFQQEGAAPVKGVTPSGVQPIPATTPEEDQAKKLRGLSSDVDIEVLPDLDVIILRGRDREVQEVAKIIEELERISAQTQPAIAVYPLKYANGDSLVSVLAKVSDSLIGGRQGRVMVVSLTQPNSLLIIGWGEAVQAMKELVEKLDMPVPPDTLFRVFPLHNAPAAQARQTLQDFVTNRSGLAGKLIVSADIRTNSLIVQGTANDIAQVAAVIEGLDKKEIAAVTQTRIFKLKNAMALDLAGTLQTAINAAQASGGSSSSSSSSSSSAAATGKSAALELLTVDPRGQKIVKSGILADVRITPDPRLNLLVVAAPAESMDLLAELIQQLDNPIASAQIKVFRILNNDAAAMVVMLKSLLARQAGTQAGAPTLSLTQEESVLTPLRFSIDGRTNSIIAVGSMVDLRIVEALLLRLDEFNVEHRKSTVYRLKNAPANDVATAINTFVRGEQLVQQAATGMVSAAEQVESQVVVVPETVSNALIISATPRYFDEITQLIQKLDEQPAQVVIQVLIAQITLNNFNEFGIELGLQDSVLFDRSLLGSLLSAPTGTPISSVATTTQSSGSTLTQSVGSSSTSNNNTQSSSIPSVIGASNTPGYAFAGSPLGNGGGPLALATAPTIGSQGFSNFGTGTTNSTLGFGGLVLQASSENVSALLRALQEVKTMHVLSRPQIMTLDNQPAYVQVGERVPRIQGTSLNAATQVNSITLENVGLILGVRPRISPEGIVVMELDAENSSVGPEATGTPVSVSNGTIIRSPAFTVTMAQTTVSVASGQTVILAGLITDSKQTDDRKVPILGDIPVINWLFHYTSHEEDRTELLIILTPHVVHSPEEAERVKQVETARMHWCLKDVESLHGDLGIRDKTPIVYPDLNPRGKLPGESFTPGKGGTDSKPEEVPAPVPKTSRWPLLNFGHTADSKPPARPDANTMAPTEPAALEEPSPALKPPANSPSSSAAAALAAPAGSVQTGYQQSISAGATPGVVYPAMPQGPQQPQPDSAAHYTVPVAEPPTGPQEPINRR